MIDDDAFVLATRRLSSSYRHPDGGREEEPGRRSGEEDEGEGGMATIATMTHPSTPAALLVTTATFVAPSDLNQEPERDGQWRSFRLERAGRIQSVL